MTERTAYDWIDDIERTQGGPNGPTIRLRACVLEMDAAEDGAKDAFAAVVQQKHDALAECAKLRTLLAAAHTQIQSFYLGTPETRLGKALRKQIDATVTAAVAAERERWYAKCAGKRHEGCNYVATCGTVCNKCGQMA